MIEEIIAAFMVMTSMKETKVDEVYSVHISYDEVSRLPRSSCIKDGSALDRKQTVWTDCSDIGECHVTGSCIITTFSSRIQKMYYAVISDSTT